MAKWKVEQEQQLWKLESTFNDASAKSGSTQKDALAGVAGIEGQYACISQHERCARSACHAWQLAPLESNVMEAQTKLLCLFVPLHKVRPAYARCQNLPFYIL